METFFEWLTFWESEESAPARRVTDSFYYWHRDRAWRLEPLEYGRERRLIYESAYRLLPEWSHEAIAQLETDSRYEALES